MSQPKGMAPRALPSVARPARHAHHLRRRRRAAGHRLRTRRRPLQREVQPVVHVQQRLLVHHLVLQQRVHALRPPHDRVGAAGDVGRLQRVQDRAVGALHVLPDGVARRPEVDGRSRGGLRVARVDPAGEQRVQLRIRPLRPQPLAQQAVDGERRYVTVVEHQRMAQRDRLLVVRGRLHEREQRRGAGAVGPVGADEGAAVEAAVGDCAWRGHRQERTAARLGNHGTKKRQAMDMLTLCDHVTARCESGGTGRRAGFRIRWPQGLGGSSPPFRTSPARAPHRQ